MQLTQTICKNCGHAFTGKYCSNCGEKVYTEHDKSIGHLAEEGVHFVSHFDGTLLTTIKTIFATPGRLSDDYCNGIRKKYFKPLSFFLLLVVFYLIFPLLSGLNMTLYNHTGQWYGRYATTRVTELMAQKQWTFDALGEHFHAASEKVSKFLLFIIIPVMALLCWPLTYKRRPLYFDQVIFSTEATAFFLMWGFMLLPLLAIILMRLATALHIPFNPVNGNSELGLGIVISVGFGIFLARAATRFYQFKKGQTLLFSLFYVAALIAFVQYIYKFILFIITIHLLH